MKLPAIIRRFLAPISKALNSVSGYGGGWHSLIREPFTGAWQRNISETQDSVVCYPTLYACLARISKDIGKLTFQLKQEDSSRIWRTTTSPSFTPVLSKPNHYQTQNQFRESWILSKLMQGNTYVLKQRDNRGVVVRLYVLDPCRVKPLVSDSGDIFYELSADRTNLLPDGNPNGENLVVPAREIIHDREVCLHHPLIGVPPLCAAYWPAVKNLKILKSATEFFEGGGQPGGILTAPGSINPDDAQRLSDYFTENFTGENSGNIAVVGDGLKFESLSAKSVDSQMVEQLRYSDEQICQPFGMPPFKIGIGSMPSGMDVDDLNNLYYSDALQDRIEHMENLLVEGLQAAPYSIECDLWPLLRMDQQKQAEFETKLVGAKIKTPDEARRAFELDPIAGGNTLWGQHQDYPLGMLATRNDLDPVVPLTPTVEPEDDEAEDAEEAAESVERMFA